MYDRPLHINTNLFIHCYVFNGLLNCFPSFFFIFFSVLFGFAMTNNTGEKHLYMSALGEENPEVKLLVD